MSWKYEGTCSAEKEYVCGKEDGFYIKYVEFSLESAVCCQHAMKKKRPLPVWLLQKRMPGIYVPSREEEQTLKEEGSPSDMADAGMGKDTGIINLNTATKAELLSLSGIGESRAEAIIAYRETNGGFRKIEDLKKVDGIKEGIFQKIREQITVE